MKTKSRTTKLPEPKSQAMVLNDAIPMPELGLTFPVRIAKAKLSALLELVASGQDVVITSDGEPRRTTDTATFPPFGGIRRGFLCFLRPDSS